METAQGSSQFEVSKARSGWRNVLLLAVTLAVLGYSRGGDASNRCSSLFQPAEPLYFARISRPFLSPIVFTEETPYSRLLENEIATALKYAQHLVSQNREFVLVSDYRGQNVPIFDGLVIDKTTSRPLFNVSLKFASIRMRNMDAGTLLESLRGRLDHSFERNRLQAENGWQRLFASDERALRRLSPERLTAIRELESLFGLKDSRGNVFGREFRTVLDMVDSGYTHEFVSQPELVRSINEMVLGSKRPETLSLIWNEHQVLEFPQSNPQ